MLNQKYLQKDSFWPTTGISGGFSGFPDMYEIKTLWKKIPIMVHMYYTPPKCGLKGNYSKVFYCQSKAIK